LYPQLLAKWPVYSNPTSQILPMTIGTKNANFTTRIDIFYGLGKENLAIIFL
jgi:hypothetical protein